MPDPNDDRARLTESARRAAEALREERARREAEARRDEEEAARFFGSTPGGAPVVQFQPQTEEQRTAAQLENMRGEELQRRAVREAEMRARDADKKASEEGFFGALVGPKPDAELLAARKRLYEGALRGLRKKVNEATVEPYEKYVPERLKKVFDTAPVGYNPAKDSREGGSRPMKTFKRDGKSDG